MNDTELRRFITYFLVVHTTMIPLFNESSTFCYYLNRFRQALGFHPHPASADKVFLKAQRPFHLIRLLTTTTQASTVTVFGKFPQKETVSSATVTGLSAWLSQKIILSRNSAWFDFGENFLMES